MHDATVASHGSHMRASASAIGSSAASISEFSEITQHRSDAPEARSFSSTSWFATFSRGARRTRTSAIVCAQREGRVRVLVAVRTEA